MKFLGKMCLKIILEVTKNRGSTLSLEDTLFEKPQGLNFIKKRLQDFFKVFSCEICEIFKSTYFYRTHPVAASGIIS